MGRKTRHDYDPMAEEEARKQRAREEADRAWNEAAPKTPAATMEDAVAQDAERQAEVEAQAFEAIEDAKFRAHLAGIGGAQMVGDMTKGVLEIIDQLMKRHTNLKRGWKGLSEGEQKDLIGRVEWAAKALVVSAVNGVAANRFPQVQAALEQVVIKDGYKLVLKAPGGSDVRHKLFDSCGKSVVLVLADPEIFAGHAPIKPMKDQPPLPGVPEPPTADPAQDDDSPLAADDEQSAAEGGGSQLH